ncbi:MAG: DEAD/DEAH box helicase [Bdellovibrionales bacterium]|nr:DEAD/DEAH box helicase [Bdellovibrionales bacterium]
MNFKDLNLIAPLLEAIQATGYEKPTPIQQKAIPIVLQGKDLLAIAQTGTGKTAGFALPILQLLAPQGAQASQILGAPVLQATATKAPGGIVPRGGPARPIRALILTPTRELASQIGESFATYGARLNLKHTVIFGGVGQNPQVSAVRQGVDIVVATPGRLLDLLNQKLIRLSDLEIFVLDEADRMLDMGFIHDVKRVIGQIPQNRQTLFFSATMPPEITKLASQILYQPSRVEVTPVASTADRIAQAVMHVQENQKTSLLKKMLENNEVTRALVFTRTKRDANRVAESLQAAGYGAAAIHGNKSQGARERALEGIKSGKLLALVATDIAARGIDIDDLSHVFNYDVPNVPETYVHRIGRTARAGRDGVAVSFCSPAEKAFLSDVERLIRKRVHVLPTPEGLEVESRKRGGGGRGPRVHAGNRGKGGRHHQRSGKPSSHRSTHA